MSRGAYNYDTRGPSDGDWSVFAERVVAERDGAREQVAALRERLKEASDCEQEGQVCRSRAPGCERHLLDRIREVLLERDQAKAEAERMRAALRHIARGFHSTVDESAAAVDAYYKGYASSVLASSGLDGEGGTT